MKMTNAAQQFVQRPLGKPDDPEQPPRALWFCSAEILFIIAFFAERSIALCLLAVQNFDSAGGSQTVSTQRKEGFHVLHGRNAAGSLDLAAAMHALDHQLHIVEVCACGGEAGAGLDVVRACLADDIAHLFLFLVGQQAGLDDDLQDLVAHRLLHGADVLAHGIVLLVLQAADVDNHIHLGGTILNGSLGFKRLAGGIHGTQREAYHAAYRDGAAMKCESNTGAEYTVDFLWSPDSV